MFRDWPRSVRRKKNSLRAPVWEAADLEPRLMLAGDVAAAVAEALPAEAAQVTDSATEPVARALGQAEVQRIDSPTIVFVDAGVTDFAVLGDGIGLDAEVVMLDSERDGILQITEVLRSRSNVQAIHLLTHGQSGRLELAGRSVDQKSLQQHAEQLREWSAALTADADVLLYGCHVGQGGEGDKFIQRLAQLTGADVAASNDLTGHAAEGGDWELEQSTGEIESLLPFSAVALQAYQETLSISISAAGATGEEQMQLQIDGVTVQTWDNIGGDFNNRQFQTFTYEAATGVSADRVQVAFTNDLFVDGGTDRNLRIDSITIDGQTFQTEHPSVFSTGTWQPEDGITPGFRESEILHGNGAFQFAELDRSGSLIRIRAAGETGGENMELRIDGQTVQAWNNVAGDPALRQFVTYQYEANEAVTAGQIQVVFTNDLFQEGTVDRNLYVDNIEVDGVLYQTEAPEVFSTGTWKPEDGIQPGFRESETLHANGYFQFAGEQPNPAQTTVTIRAAGATNEEIMELQVDGVVVNTWENIGGNDQAEQFVDYTFQVDGQVTADQIRIAFINDFFENGIDRNLRVDQIELNGVVFESEAATVFSTGTWLPEDGIVPGFRQSEYLNGNGYFQYNATGLNPGVIALETSVLAVNETDGAVAIRILRTGGSDGQVTVDYSTIDATAVAASDYQSQVGTLIFEAGQTQKTVLVPIVNDSLAEGTESFNFAIDNVTGGATLLAPRTATVTINDDDVTLPDYASFASTAGLTLNGDAKQVGSQLLLTEAIDAQEGTAFFNVPLPINVDTSFQTRFQFQLTGGQQALGADGFTFVLQNDPRGATAIGPGGGELSYSGIVNSLAVEFDTYQNAGDINNNHVSVLVNGDVSAGLETRIPLLDLNGGSILNAWIDYSGATDQLAVYLSDSASKPAEALLVADVDLSALVGEQAFLGFTAGTGGSVNAHRLLDWEFSLEPPSAILPPTPGTTLVSETVVAGLNQPTDIAWTADGQNLYISEKSGLVKVVRNGVTQSTPFIDIRDQVNGTRDRGLLDIALHPDFENNPYVYLLFTYDPPEVFDNIGDPLAGPDQKGNRAGRLVRVTADVATNYTTAVAGSEVILLGKNSTWENFNGFVNSTVDFNEPPAGILADGTNLQDFISSDSESHTIASLAFANDGSLFVSIGDGASYNRVDPRAIRVQDIDNLSGKVLRIDPLTGEGLADNPFYSGDPDANRSKVYQLGLRNPFRISVDPNSGQLYVGDVGWTRWEEINAGGAGANFGWPYFEGGSGTSERTGGYQNLPEAIEFYNSGASVTAATFALNHAVDGINAIVLGGVYTGDVYPEEFQGDLFFNDLGQGLVRNANLDADGNVISVQNFATGAGIVVAIEQGPDGTMHYVDLDDGLIGRWYFA